MLATLWLMFTTFCGWGVSYFFFPEHPYICSAIGFIFGLMIICGVSGDGLIDGISNAIDD